MHGHISVLTFSRYFPGWLCWPACAHLAGIYRLRVLDLRFQSALSLGPQVAAAFAGTDTYLGCGPVSRSRLSGSAGFALMSRCRHHISPSRYRSRSCARLHVYATRRELRTRPWLSRAASQPAGFLKPGHISACIPAYVCLGSLLLTR